MTDQTHVAATALASAEWSRQPIPPLTATYAGLTVEDAYEIQQINVRERVRGGRTIYGHKVGLTAKPMQQMLGVDEPDYGYLLDDMVVEDGATVPVARYLQPRVEVEVAFVLGAPLYGPGVTVEDVLKATAYVVPAIEIIDSRIVDWKITLADTIADNASSAGIVVGRQRTSVDGLDLPAVQATLSKNGEVVDTGTGEAVLGNPAIAVAWLANKLSAFGVELLAGHVILPGSCTRAVDVGAGDVIVGSFTPLGQVSVRFT
jgi:2-keto-4-pentenoate hydratase